MVVYSRSHEYTLSIRVSADGFCFAVHHPQRPAEYAYVFYDPDLRRPLPANLKAARESVPLLQHDYGQVQLLLADADYTVVPAEFGTEAAARAVFVESFPHTTAQQEVLVRPLSAQHVLLFSVEKTWLKWANALFPGVEIMHAMSPVMRFALHDGADRFLCYLHGRHMDVACIREGRLQFVNKLDNDTPDNALYYLLGVWQALGLSQTDDVLTLAGRAADVRALSAKLGRFIRQVQAVDAVTAFHASELARQTDVPFDLQTLTGMNS